MFFSLWCLRRSFWRRRGWRSIWLTTGVKPVVNQIERHPRLLQKDLLKHHKEKNIVVTARRSS
jgi:diketogulonate reductase-like aldo/keto reductase